MAAFVGVGFYVGAVGTAGHGRGLLLYQVLLNGVVCGFACHAALCAVTCIQQVGIPLLM